MLGARDGPDPVFVAVTAALLITPALSGCLGGDTVESTFYVKDAATDEFEEIWIEFSEIEVHHAGDDDGDSDDGADGDGADGGQGGQGGQATIASSHDGGGDDGEWITTVDETRALDLLKFSSDDAKAFLGDADLPTGKYTQIRIHVNEAWGIESDGSNTTFRVASNMAMIPRPWTLEDNGTTPQITIDLDLDRSLQESGGQGGQDGWTFTPVIGFVQVQGVDEDPRQDQPNPGQ